MFLYFFMCCFILSSTTAQTISTEKCVTPNGEEAQCVSVYSCAPFVAVGSNPSNETIAFIEQSQCGRLKVCCGTSTTFANKTTSGTRNKWRPIAPRNRCGLQHVDDRFYNEKVTAVDEFPWIVLLGTLGTRKNPSTNFSQLCTGALISRRYVLTTSFCAAYISMGFNLIARLGEYHRVNATDCADNPHFPECTDSVIDLAIESYERHPDYRWPTKADVGLFRLAANVQFSDFIRPICLPTAGVTNATTDDLITFSGWGFGWKNEKFVEAQEKKRLIFKIVSHEKCLDLWKSKRYVQKYISTSTYCAIEQENNIENATCDGDRGGPAMIRLKTNQWQLDGLISHEDCGLGKIIVRISDFMDWILENIKP